MPDVAEAQKSITGAFVAANKVSMLSSEAVQYAPDPSLVAASAEEVVQARNSVTPPLAALGHASLLSVALESSGPLSRQVVTSSWALVHGTTRMFW